MNPYPQSVSLVPTVGQEDRVVVLCPSGELQPREVGRLTQALEQLYRRGCGQVVLDLSKVLHLDYRGVASLARRVMELRSTGGDVRLAGLSPYLDAILRVGGAYQVFHAYDSLDAACASFGPSSDALLH